ncbi:Hypothetical predicted protein [Podarcis lilfordi]|uniref:Uncharacterized protein n=1 Tax=Podarcis lilfordi TaxID=74358 RepID=A0AA35KP05_9SAUR|nr:Hypothetical predicted protein [Podarcis lilfordi]
MLDAILLHMLLQTLQCKARPGSHLKLRLHRPCNACDSDSIQLNLWLQSWLDSVFEATSMSLTRLQEDRKTGVPGTGEAAGLLFCLLVPYFQGCWSLIFKSVS